LAAAEDLRLGEQFRHMPRTQVIRHVFYVLGRLFDVAAKCALLLFLEVLARLPQCLRNSNQGIDGTSLLRFELRGSLLLRLCSHLRASAVGTVNNLPDFVLGLACNTTC